MFLEVWKGLESNVYVPGGFYVQHRPFSFWSLWVKFNFNHPLGVIEGFVAGMPRGCQSLQVFTLCTSSSIMCVYKLHIFSHTPKWSLDSLYLIKYLKWLHCLGTKDKNKSMQWCTYSHSRPDHTAHEEVAQPAAAVVLCTTHSGPFSLAHSGQQIQGFLEHCVFGTGSGFKGLPPSLTTWVCLRTHTVDWKNQVKGALWPSACTLVELSPHITSFQSK